MSGNQGHICTYEVTGHHMPLQLTTNTSNHNQLCIRTKFNDKTMYFKLKTIDCHLKGFEAGDEILIVRGTYVKKDDPASEG